MRMTRWESPDVLHRTRYSPFALSTGRTSLPHVRSWFPPSCEYPSTIRNLGTGAFDCLSTARPETIQALREAFGFTQEPLYLQYIKYLSHALRGDFGISISYFPTPVTSVIGLGLLWTLLLAGLAVMISFALGNVLGIVGAWRRGGFVDSVLPPLLTFIGSFPYFFSPIQE